MPEASDQEHDFSCHNKILKLNLFENIMSISHKIFEINQLSESHK